MTPNWGNGFSTRKCEKEVAFEFTSYIAIMENCWLVGFHFIAKVDENFTPNISERQIWK